MKLGVKIENYVVTLLIKENFTGHICYFPVYTFLGRKYTRILY